MATEKIRVRVFSFWVMLVPIEKQNQVIEIVQETIKTIVVGDAFAQGTHMGPMVDSAQQRSVQGYIQKRIDQGATLVTGGPDRPEGLEKGYFFKKMLDFILTT